MRQNSDAVVIGAGAAGLMCAIEAGKRGRRVVVLEHADRVGKKILISGGGRCNFTNIHCRPENFISENPHFAKSALARYTPQDFLAVVEKYKIPYHEKTLGQLFCDRSAQDILDLLIEECRRANVLIITNTTVQEITRPERFLLRTSIGEFEAPALVIATGGLSIPKMGATAFGYEIARKFGLRIQECRPALVPLTFNERDRQRYSDMAGISTEVIVSTDSQRFREKMLFTHRGLSGPAILQISSYWKHGNAIALDLAPGRDVLKCILDSPSGRDLSSARAAIRAVLPNRMAERWLELHPPKDWRNASILESELQLHRWQLIPAGTEGYEKAEVTAGGVDTEELSAKTMESRKVPGLYFIGEVVDVTGQLGGFNFQWAWASGYSAGRAV